ncbi:hypothetical protein OJAV_G00107830 [Oryzias javanicus]|uniref:Aurora kinase A and ninein-interacting protein n=1 Tax=Oryzias javanicus TaxID=123683 RepID=A0A437CUA3_ORYJA|nr:hypothetical protein OJAV_G00107830 [Oryzias javanicus]
MKTSKTTQPAHSQEECGVWLDPVQLKGKAKQKCRVRPISKLLNPLAKGEGYSLAVALNFTQTKMEMPKTKQSIISTFFTPHQRVVNKTSSSGLQKFNPVQLSASSNASVTKHGSSPQNLDESGVAFEEEGKSFTKTDPPFLSETEEGMAEDPNQPPPNKKRVVEKSLLLDESEAPPQAWSLDPLFNCNQYTDSQFYQTDEKITAPTYLNESEMTFFDSLQSEEAFGNVMDVKGRTSTQKTIITSFIPEEDDDKENKSKSNKKASSPFESNCNRSEAKTILHQNQPSNDAETDEWIDSRWTKTSSLPLDKDQRDREPDENTLASLFTQDSEGFRVISHRGLQTRSPLKDHSHLVMRTYKSFEDEEEMLFTQDSQGNMVIKH